MMMMSESISPVYESTFSMQQSAALKVWVLGCEATLPAHRLEQLNRQLSPAGICLIDLPYEAKQAPLEWLESWLNEQYLCNGWLLTSEEVLASLYEIPHHHVLEQRVAMALDKMATHPILQGLQCLLITDDVLTADTLKAYVHAGVCKVFRRDLSLEQWCEQLTMTLKFAEKLMNVQAFAIEQTVLNEGFSDRSLLIEKELNKTRLLQQSLLPPTLASGTQPAVNEMGRSKRHYESEQIRVSGMYIPCDAIGGDLYDLCEFHDGSLGVIITDVSGHGVPAAFVTALLKSSFYRITHHHQTPDQVLFQLNNQLAAVVKTGEYLTAAYLHFLDGGKTVEYGGAGHPYPILYRAKTNTVELLAENGTPLVWVPDMPYEMQFTGLESGDKILLFTDGVTELTNPQQELYTEERLATLLPEILQEYPEGGGEILEAIVMELSDFTQGHPLNDDLTMVLIEIK